MSELIRTITDKPTFEKILNKYFRNNNVFLKMENGNLKIQYFGYSDGIAAFKIPDLKTVAQNSIIFTRQESNTVSIFAAYNDNQEKNIFLFTINKMEIVLQSRVEDRKSLEGANSNKKNIVYISNLISNPIIHNTLSFEAKKIDRIRDSILNEMSQAFNYIKIYFCNEGKADLRMNYFYKNKEPIYISQFNKSKSEGNTKISFYLNNIYSKDNYLQSRKEFISEISVPILYRTKLPYGYVQINNTSPVTNTMYNIVKQFALLIDELMNKEKIFPKSNEKLIVSNVSMNGLGIVFKEKKYIRYFNENNLICFDMLLPDNKQASIMAMVRNITFMDNNIIMIGCSIEEIDALSEVNYEEYVTSFNIPAQ